MVRDVPAVVEQRVVVALDGCAERRCLRTWREACAWLSAPSPCSRSSLPAAGRRGLTPDNSTLIPAESRGNRLTAFDIEAGGGLSNRGTPAGLPAGPRPPATALPTTGGERALPLACSHVRSRSGRTGEWGRPRRGDCGDGVVSTRAMEKRS